MTAGDRSVLHVLPHPGGGGETYVDLLEGMPGYRFTRTYLASSATGAQRELPRGVARAFRLVPGHDLVHVHGEVASGLCLPPLATRPSVVTLHGLHLVRRLTGLGRWAAALNLRVVVRAADRTICVSQAEHDNLRAVLGSKASRRTVVIRNGVPLPAPSRDEERAEVRRELGFDDADVVAIWVGSLDERKDPLTAVRAAVAASLPLLVVGNGPLRPAVEASASARVRVLGRRDDVPRLLAASDLFVHTGWREGLSLSLLEAMAHGLPSVVASVPENAEAVGESGISVPVRDVGEFVEALRRLASSAGEREVLGRGARARAEELFDAETMVARTRAVYDAVTGQRARDR